MRTHQSAVFLNDVLHSVREGGLAPAGFQRPYVWSQDDVLKLVKSVLRGYALGTFVLWTPNGKADLSKVGRQRLGQIVLNAADRYASLVLDGQNRLASLGWMAHDMSRMPGDMTEHEQAVWGGQRLVCDLDNGEICFADSDGGNGVFRLPIRVLFESSQLNRMLLDRWDTDWAHLSVSRKEEGLHLLQIWENAFRDARVIVADIQDATAEEAKEAFLHICKVGVPMSEDDFTRAMAWAL